VESAVEGCPHDFHRNAWTRLQNRRKIVDMIAVLGVIAAVAATRVTCWMLAARTVLR
jgi:Ni/Fe-hydrogenase subunit HybB-like protein